MPLSEHPPRTAPKGPERRVVPRAATWAVVMCLTASLILCPALARADQDHRVFFQNTDHELHIYRIYGDEPGKTLLVIGGIQGNEPGGYLAADLYVELSLKKGNLIVVPRANLCSIVRNVRGVNGDMNRKFADLAEPDRDRQIIDKLKELIREADFLLNLHDGSGFYSPERISDIRNPDSYGQSIIADCDRFESRRRNVHYDLQTMARRVCARVNPAIKNSDHHFHFNNHRTAARDTRHSEQRKSATYFAMSQHEIPAFGIETSKCIDSPMRVRYQTMVINAFMEEFGIVPANPRIALPDPLMKYMIVSLGDAAPVVVYNGGTIAMQAGEILSIIHVEANYERGITANVLGVGSMNDLRRKIPIHRPTRVIVKKDSLTCGTVTVELRDRAAPGRITGRDVQYLIVAVDGVRLAVAPGEHLQVARGAQLTLQDVITRCGTNQGLKVNFKGFVGNTLYNDGEDRGYVVNTAEGLMRQYSVDGQGVTWPVVVVAGRRTLAQFYVDILTSMPSGAASVATK